MKLITISFLVSILILTVGLAFAYAHVSKSDTMMILHFDNYRGPDYLGSGQDVLLILLSGMGVVLINYALALGFRSREHFLATILSISSICVASLILISVFVIIANN